MEKGVSEKSTGERQWRKLRERGIVYLLDSTTDSLDNTIPKRKNRINLPRNFLRIKFPTLRIKHITDSSWSRSTIPLISLGFIFRTGPSSIPLLISPLVVPLLW